jgi:hypothetical protein
MPEEALGTRFLSRPGRFAATSISIHPSHQVSGRGSPSPSKDGAVRCVISRVVGVLALARTSIFAMRGVWASASGIRSGAACRAPGSTTGALC